MPLRDVDAQVVCPRQRRDVPQRGGREAAHYALRAPHEDVLRPDRHAVRGCCLWIESDCCIIFVIIHHKAGGRRDKRE